MDKKNIKDSHIHVCLKEDVYENKNQFESIKLTNKPLGCLNFFDLYTKVDFLGKKISYPIYIPAMTGGLQTENINKDLFLLASKFDIPLFLGSFKIIQKHPEYKNQFCFDNPQIPIIGNISANFCSIKNLDFILNTVNELNFFALSLHLNTGQELIQKNGDRDFSNLLNNIKTIKKNLKIPVIIKETGMGIWIDDIKNLLDLGVDFVDIAGSGGTNWMLVEGFLNKDRAELSRTFKNFGYSTLDILKNIKNLPSGYKKKILVSGGIKSGLDIAKSLCFGPSACSVALPLLKKLKNQDGFESAEKYIKDLIYGLKISMMLVGAKNINELDESKIYKNAL